jgi:FkbM family methyltransferase
MKIKILIKKLVKILKLIRKPSLIPLIPKGVNIEMYELLNQPWIRDLEIKTVLDIGANVGHFALAISYLLPEAKVYSFEPLPECFKELEHRTSNNTNIKAFNVALGNESGSLMFRRNEYNFSSSFLEMSPLHVTAFPESAKCETTEVDIERLDDFAQNLEIKKPFLAKIDVQGFEDQVLKGGMETIYNANMIIVETSFFTLYKNQPLFDDIYLRLKAHNYTYVGAFDSLRDPISGRVLQEDSIFIRSK